MRTLRDLENRECYNQTFRLRSRADAPPGRPEQLPRVVPKELKTVFLLFLYFLQPVFRSCLPCVSWQEPGLCGRVGKRRAALGLPEGALPVCPVYLSSGEVFGVWGEGLALFLTLGVCPLCGALTLGFVPRSRSASCSDRGQKEPTLPLHRPTPCWNDSGCKSTVGSSAPTECSGTPDHPKQLRTPCSRPLSAGMQGHFLDTRAASIAPPSTPLPSPVPSSYRSQLTIDQQTERSGQPGRQPLPPSAPAMTHRNDGRSLTQPPSPKCHELSSPEHGLEEGMWKRASLPQRPAPPWTKWAHAVREDSLSEDTSVPEFADLKHYKNQSLLSSCSTMDPDTPGRISLRISESALQTSPPPRGDYEDEVFVKDLHPRAASSPTLEALPPPPPLPPPMSQETLVMNSSDDFPPPPPQAVCEAVPDSEAYKEAGSR